MLQNAQLIKIIKAGILPRIKHRKIITSSLFLNYVHLYCILISKKIRNAFSEMRYHIPENH